MPKWRIYYSDHIAEGSSKEEWTAAQDTDVQVVVLYEPPTVLKWRGVTDRQLWTGQDEYRLFDWGKKIGAWAENYWDIWQEAAYGSD